MSQSRSRLRECSQGIFDFEGVQASSVLSYEEVGPAEALMERIVDPSTVALAISRVKSNKGSPGADGMSVGELDEYWAAHGARICQALLAGDYVPQPVQRVVIPKPDGGERLLGIPRVVDRVVGQMVLIVLEPIFEPHFSESSYGFRRGRSAHQAVAAAKEIISSGRDWVVDIDLEKYFDTVNHNVLMSRVARRVTDKRVLKLVRRFLRAGAMIDGVLVRTDEGTPQGGPLSPLLANIMLDDLDKMLESRGHRFVRYADDCNIYVGSEAAATRVLARVTEFLEVKLRLRVNRSKSAAAPTSLRRFPGFYASTCEGGGSSEDLVQSPGTLPVGGPEPDPPYEQG